MTILCRWDLVMDEEVKELRIKNICFNEAEEVTWP